jgi:hypothetical protein
MEVCHLLSSLGSVESQTGTVETLGRLVSNLEVDSGLYSETCRQGLEFVTEAEKVTQLFEFNTGPNTAGLALRSFETFFQNPEEGDQVIAALEAQRLIVFDQ